MKYQVVQLPPWRLLRLLLIWTICSWKARELMSKHDSFPPRTAASRGRVNLQRTNLNSSQEPLSAHPLLSPSVPQHAESNVPAQTLTPPRYVPYTPRQQRVIPTTTSPASTAQVLSAVSASPQSQGATGKLQLVNLKAAAQGLGLDTSSIGWAILERLVGSGIADEGEEWAEIWNAVTTGKVRLSVFYRPSRFHLSTDVHRRLFCSH